MAVSKQTAIKEKRYDPHFHYHDLGWDAVKKLPKEINKPAMLIKSIKDPTDARFVVVTNMVDRVGRPVIVPVKPAGNGQYFNLDFTENAALSGYGRTGFNSFVQTAKNENRILYVYKKSNQTSKNTRGVQFTNDILAADYSKNLSQFKQLVKTKFTGTLFENGYDSDGNLIQFQKWGIGETAEERTVSKERFDRLRAEKNAKIEEVRKAEVEKRREAVKKEKAEKWRKVEKTKDYYRDMMKRQRSKRADTAMRGKIKAYRRAA